MVNLFITNLIFAFLLTQYLKSLILVQCLGRQGLFLTVTGALDDTISAII